MSSVLARFSSHSPEHTAQLAADLGRVLQPGDTLLLQGPIGAGKTHFARALIQSLQDPVEDVPSPTFTLIQTYDTEAGPIWHADLYRLSSPDEIVETGLLDAMQDAICLIEWPDRLGPDAPDTALTIELIPGLVESERDFVFSSPSVATWTQRLEALNDIRP